MPQLNLAKQQLADEITVIDDETLQLSLEEQLQLEYNCQTPSESSLAKIISLNYIHYLDIQEQMKDSESRINSLYYSHNTCEVENFKPYKSNNACKRSQFELQRFSILSKEADRAYRRYLTAMTTLRMFKQPPLNINFNKWNNVQQIKIVRSPVKENE